MICIWGTVILMSLRIVLGDDADITISSNLVLDKTDFCPGAGYFYRPADPGCWLCFCRNSTAACWRRESGCGSQIHQIEHLSSGNRVRRSPVGLSDIFFRDATREFFQKQLPQQCKPHEGSFSDGCPPADWCVGCTVCDCDANGRWDCHILSFCNREEKKKKRKVPLPKSMPTRRVYHEGKATPKTHVIQKPNKSVKKSVPKVQKAQSRSPNGRRQNNVKTPINIGKKPSNNNNRPNVRRPNQKGTKPNNNKKTSNNGKANKSKPIQRKPQPKFRPKAKPKPTTRKPHTKRYMARKKQYKKTTELPKTTDKNNVLRKQILTTRKPLQRINHEKLSDKIIGEEDIKSQWESKNGLEESELGRKIVRKIMGTVQKMLGKRMEKLQNLSRVERSIDEKDCVENKIKQKPWKLKDSKIRKKKWKSLKNSRYDLNSVRRKREALDLDINLIDLNDANIVNDSINFTVKRITKTVRDLNSNNSSTNLIDLTTSTTTDKNKVNLGSNKNDNNITVLSKNNSNQRDLRSNSSNINDLNVPYLNSTKLTIEGLKTDLREKVMNNLTSSFTTEKISTTNELLNTTLGTQYYKYSVERNSRNTNANSVTTEVVTTVSNKTNATIEGRTNKVKSLTERTTKEFVLFSHKPEFNDLKHKKWERMKILRGSTQDYLSKFDNNRELNEDTFESSLLKPLKNEKNREMLTRNVGVVNKFNMKKIVINNVNTHDKNTNSLSNITISDASRNTSSLQVLLRNLMKELNTNTTSTTKLRTKFSLFKYLRNIFKNIFHRNKGKHVMGHKTNEAMTLQILCENIGACYLNQHNRISLRNKIHDLNTETEKIFRTIKMIKGLLYLIVLPVIKDNSTTKNPLKDEIQKLDTILRGNYEENSNLTQTQASQISYVKDNIQQFVESVSKFAKILNEILNVLYKNNKKYSCQRNLRFYSKKKKLNALNKIKNLLVKYNIVQNTFMKNMYKLLTEIEKNPTTEKSKPKVSDRDLDETQVVDEYSRKIIQNLRILKELAQALSSKRNKRQTKRPDDAVEYLLMLMEYLLKQNHPLDTAPVHDGIDLLIEAIQNAPDIKTIRKKVLEVPTTQRVTRTVSNLKYINENSNSSSKIFNEDNFLRNKMTPLVNESASEDEVTQIVFYNRFDQNDATTDSFTATESGNSRDEVVDTGAKIGFDKFESTIEDSKRLEAFNSEIEDEPILSVVINATDILEITTIPQIEKVTYDYKLDDDPERNTKPKLDWIEESFDKELNESKEENIFNITTTTHTTVETTLMPIVVKSIDNISSITVEVEDEKKKNSNVGTDEVMHKKQIDFLNSLDYETEGILDDSDVKDDEKFSGDFPSYFVK